MQCLCFLLVTTVWLAGCFAPAAGRLTLDPGNDAPTIAVLLSSSNKVYRSAADSFTQHASARVLEWDLTESSESAVEKGVRAANPALIVSLGAAATTLAAQRIADKPLVYAMVVNHRRYDILSRANIYGVSLEPPALQEFSQFKLVLPDLQRVTVFYSADSAVAIEEAAAELQGLDIQLTAVQVSSLSELKSRFSQSITSAQAIWLANDFVIMNKASFKFLKTAAIEARLPLVTSLSDEFAKAGAFASVSVDLSNLGAQTAALCRAVLQGSQTLKVQPPIGASLVVNEDVAKEIGRVLPSDAIPFIQNIITSMASPGSQ